MAPFEINEKDHVPSPVIEASPSTTLLILVLAVLIGGMTGSGLAFGLGAIQGIDVQEALSSLTTDSSRSLRNYVRVANLINHFFTFTVPALAVGWFFYRYQIWTYLKLDRQPGSFNLSAGVAFVIFAFPVAQLFYWLNQQLPLPDWVWKIEASTEGMIRGLLVMESPAELLLNLLVVAVLPAIGEELVFRGILQQQLQRLWGRAVPAIWVAAILFSAIHLQFAGFLPRAILGAVLGYLFYWTNNLWVPVIGHFVTNGVQVIAQYAAGDRLAELNLENTDEANWTAGLLSLVLLIATGYYLKNRNQK